MKSRKFIAILLVAAMLCLMTACGKDAPGVQGSINDQVSNNVDPNAVFTPKPGEEDPEVVVLSVPTSASDEKVTYYFVGDIYSRQESVITYTTEEAAQANFNTVSTYEDAKIEGSTVSFKFVSNAFQGMSKQQVVEYWQKQFDSSKDFYSTWSVGIQLNDEAGDGSFDAKAVQLVGKGETTTETVTYYFINNKYVSQRSVIVYGTEETAKANFNAVSSYEEAKLEGNTVSFKFISGTFTGLTREQVVEYWEKQFASSDGFYANYTVSEIDTPQD